VVKGTFGLAKSANGADFKAQLQFSNIDLEQCLGDMFGIRRLEGKGNLGLAIDSSGSSVYELTKGLNGTAGLTSRNGAIAGFNVEQLLKRIERRPLSGGGEFRTGKTPYESLTVNLKIIQGVANVEEVRMEGPSVGLALTGSASIPPASSTSGGLRACCRSPREARPLPHRRSNYPSWCRGRGTTLSYCRTRKAGIQRSGAAQTHPGRRPQARCG
jgi:AsmA protein